MDINTVTQTSTAEAGAGVPQPRRKRGAKFFLFLLAVIIGAGLFYKIKQHHSDVEAEQSAPTIGVIKVTHKDVYNEVPIPAEFRPYVQSELHAMVTGYVKEMNVDFGDKVKQGQVLATLEVPELTDELHNAQAKEKQAEAEYNNAHLIYTRMQEVNKQHSNLVAQQDIDTAQSKDAGAEAAVVADKADIEKYQTLVNYTQIAAPFDGIVTKRSVDPGALVQAGTSSDKSMPMLRVSDNYLLRLDFPVSVDYVKFIHPGDLVTVRVDSLGGKTFTGKITRFTNEVNDETRTMTTELEVENPNLEIVPGMYAVALLKFQSISNALVIPIQAVANPKEPVVNVVNANNEVEPRPVKLGIEMPDVFQVLSGLKEGEQVVIGNSVTVHPGQKVVPKVLQQSSME